MPPDNRRLLPEREEQLWLAFVDAYTTSKTRPAVDLFLRALLGGPRPEPTR